ncbi:MAG: hypothetical protein J6128_02275 [Clostridia bacterium]|nr:hypothetical protein [Clostridia bacterium]
MKTRRFITLLLAMILSLGMIVHVSAVAVPELPTAKVTEVTPLATDVPIYDLSGSPTGETVDIEAEYCFEPDDPSQEQLDYYGSWYADYRVSFDRPILKESFGLYGEYSGYGTEFSVAFLFPTDMMVEDSILLLQAIGMEGAVTYQDCVKNIEKFYCGVFNKSYDNIGTTMTVELVIRDPEGSSDNWITVESVDYTFVGPALPEAVVEELTPETGLPLYDIDTFTPTGEIVKELEAEYKFTPVEPTQAQLDYYGSWKADYRVSFDTEILKHTFGLYGAYNGYGQEFSVAFLFPIGMNVGDALYLLNDSGITDVTYKDCVNNIQEFICGVFNLDPENAGKTMTVELVIKNPDDPNAEWITVETVDYTFKGTTTEILPPLPTVTVTPQEELTNKDVYKYDDLSKPVSKVDSIPAVYLFEPDDPSDETEAFYRSWDCDYRVTFSDDLAPESFGLYGAYGSYDIAFLFPTAAGTDPVYLLAATGFGDVTYGDLLDTVQDFVCGAFNLSTGNIGKTMTVELVITNPADPTESYVLATEKYEFSDVSKLLYTVTLISQDVNGNTGIATLEGGGVFPTLKKHHVKAPDVEGYNFVGWYKDEYSSDSEPIYEKQNYAFTIGEEDITLVAVYIPVGEGMLHVIGSEYTVNDGEKQTSRNDFNIEIGASTKVSYLGEDFLYWVNISNNIVSTEADYNFTFVNETTLRLITSSNMESEESVYVIFKNAYDQVLSAGRVIDVEGAEELFPKSNPGKLGLDFDKWVFEGTEDEATPESIAAKMTSEGSEVTVVPAYKEAADTDTYTVKVYAKTAEGEKPALEKTVAISDPLVVYTSEVVQGAELDANVFSYWTLDGETPISFDPEQCTVIGAKGTEIKLTAVFDVEADPEPVVAITGFTASTNGNKYRLSVTLSFYLPEGYTLHKSGFVRSTNGEDFAYDDLVIGANGTKVHETSFTCNNGIYMMNLNTSNPDKAFFFKAFITFTNDQGELETLYSDMVSGSYSSIQ